LIILYNKMDSNLKNKRPKILFWINTFFLHFGISNYIQKEFDSDLFAIIDVPNNPKKFFQQQKIVDFKKIWFYHNFINLKN